MTKSGYEGNTMNFDGRYTYEKLPNPPPKSVVLLQAFKLRYGALSKAFNAYNNKIKGGTFDKALKPSDYVLVLLFYEKRRKHLFTTTRRYAPEKEKYLSKHTGERFTLTYNHTPSKTAR